MAFIFSLIQSEKYKVPAFVKKKGPVLTKNEVSKWMLCPRVPNIKGPRVAQWLPQLFTFKWLQRPHQTD